MSTNENASGAAVATAEDRVQIVDQVRQYYQARDQLRRGICLLNAGCYDRAIEAFSAAQCLNPESDGLADYLTRCYIGQGDLAAAAEQMAVQVERDSDDITARIRHAMLLWKNQDRRGALVSLRDGVRDAPDCAELHFQLGTILAAAGDDEEAEMRFTTAVTLDARHAKAMTGLAMCFAARNQPARAVPHLQRAQSLRPDDARIAFLLAMASQAAGKNNTPVNYVATMPAGDRADDHHAVNALSHVIEHDPEVVGAFTDLSPTQVEETAYGLLLEAIRVALERHPQRADLHYQRSRLLAERGAIDQALASVEQALRISECHVQALILSAKLLHRAGRPIEAVDRLERTLELGGRYADVYLMLGNLCRDIGRTDRARDAYQCALSVNKEYHAAAEALEALPN